MSKFNMLNQWLDIDECAPCELRYFCNKSLSQWILSGELLNVQQCSELSFNDAVQPAYKRALRLIREAKLNTVKAGRITYVSKSLLEAYFQIESCNEKEIGGITTHYDGETKSIVIHLPKN